MNIKEFSYNLQNLYQEMSETFSDYQNKSGLNCVISCGGKCCQNPEVEASIFEMLPMAQKILEEGKLDEWVQKLETAEQDFCLIYDQQSGKCTRYEERPSLCRMFGVAGYKNKRNEVTLSICKFIKESYGVSEVQITPNEPVPMLKDWSFKLGSVDHRLIQDKMPINQALYQALMKVALYAQLQE